MLIKNVKCMSIFYHSLIYEKVYDVIGYTSSGDSDYIVVIDEKGFKEYFNVADQGKTFTDVTIECRNELIDDILC